jgi:hypothetical protein
VVYDYAAVICTNPLYGLDFHGAAPQKPKEDPMRSVLLGIITAAGLVLASTTPTLSAPVNASTISQAAAELNPIAQASPKAGRYVSSIHSRLLPRARNAGWTLSAIEAKVIALAHDPFMRQKRIRVQTIGRHHS